MFASTARSKDSVFRAFLLGSILHDAFLCGIAQEASRKCQVLSTRGTIGRFEGTSSNPHITILSQCLISECSLNPHVLLLGSVSRANKTPNLRFSRSPAQSHGSTILQVKHCAYAQIPFGLPIRPWGIGPVWMAFAIRECHSQCSISNAITATPLFKFAVGDKGTTISPSLRPSPLPISWPSQQRSSGATSQPPRAKVFQACLSLRIHRTVQHHHHGVRNRTQRVQCRRVSHPLP